MSRSKILVVEDEALTGMELQKKLVLWGYDVIDIVSSGEDAVKKALELDPDLILMDILLKGCMNGIDAAKVIRKNKEIPIIYLTAYCNSETFQGAKITQPQAYLIKPFDENELKFAIEMAFHGYESQLKLKRSEEHYRILAENAEDMIFIINRDLMVEYVNESSLKYLKLNKEDIIGKPVQDLFRTQEFKDQISSLKNVLNTGNSKREKNLFIFPDCEVWLDTRLKPLRDQQGEIYSVMGISREIKEGK
ncbi:MAG: response regulator [Methanobacterium sp.]|nr:response regulator [Methanobacterium sp.]